MAMPKTAMNKYRGLISRQNNIRTAWKFFYIQPKTITHFMQKGTHQFFRLGILPFHLRHVTAALFRADFIHKGNICRKTSFCQRRLLTIKNAKADQPRAKHVPYILRRCRGSYRDFSVS
jgi:hypothetical protein